jgi:hypothetical protein
VPFVQGRLRQEALSAVIETECGHCGQALHLKIDSRLDIQVAEAGAKPRVYVPLVDVRKLDEPSIIDSF